MHKNRINVSSANNANRYRQQVLARCWLPNLRGYNLSARWHNLQPGLGSKPDTSDRANSASDRHGFCGIQACKMSEWIPQHPLSSFHHKLSALQHTVWQIMFCPASILLPAGGMHRMTFNNRTVILWMAVAILPSIQKGFLYSASHRGNFLLMPKTGCNYVAAHC